jgi:hypothetical protein
MTDSQVRLGAVMSVVLLVLAAVIYLMPAKKDASDEDKAATADVWSFEEDDVQKLTVHASDHDVVLSRADNGWEVDEPYEDRAEMWTVRSLVADLARAKKAVPITASDPEKFGVGAKPEATIEVELKDGRKLPLVIGKKTPIGDKTYAKLASGAIVALGVDVHDKLLADPMTFRDHHMVKFDPKLVAGVTIQSDLGTLDVSRQGDEWWSKGFTRADDQKVEDLILALLDVRFDEFAPIDLLAQLGKPAYLVTVKLTTGDPVVMRFDAPSQQGTLAAVDAGNIGFVNTGSLEFLKQGPKDIGDPDAFPFEPSTVDKVVVSLGSSKWSLERNPTGWKRDGNDEPKGGDALATLDKAKIYYRRDPVPPVGTVWGTVTLTTAGKDRVVECGDLLDDKRVCRDRAGGETYLVPQDQLDSVGKFFE